MFDGSTVTLNSLTTNGTSSSANLMGWVISNYDGGYPVYPSTLPLFSSGEHADTFLITYVQVTGHSVLPTDSYYNNLFTFQVTNDSSLPTAYLSLVPNFYEPTALSPLTFSFYDAGNTVIDANATVASNSEYFVFNFDTNNTLIGMSPFNNIQGILQQAGTVMQPWSQEWYSTFLILVKQSPVMLAYAAMTATLGTCCTTGFSTAAEATVCSNLQLAAASTGNNPTAECVAIMSSSTAGNFCISNPTNFDCITWCRTKGNDCSAVYTAYCGGLTDAEALDLPVSVCGCFMSTGFYDTYNASIRAAGFGSILDGPGQQPGCNYIQCSSSATAIPRTLTAACPTQTICIESLLVTNNGSLGNITASQMAACGATSATGTGAGGGTGTGTGSWLTNSFTFLGLTFPLFAWLAVGVVLLVLVFAFITIILSHGNKKNQAQRRRQGKK